MTDELEQLVRALINKLDLIHSDPTYRSVWTIYHTHVGTYTGPNYGIELEEVRECLARLANRDPNAKDSPSPQP